MLQPAAQAAYAPGQGARVIPACFTAGDAMWPYAGP